MKMKVKLTQDYKGLPSGSCVHVEYQNNNWYSGTWSSQYGSVTVAVPKDICEVMDK
jgi:hypothetical protein